MNSENYNLLTVKIRITGISFILLAVAISSSEENFFFSLPPPPPLLLLQELKSRRLKESVSKWQGTLRNFSSVAFCFLFHLCHLQYLHPERFPLFFQTCSILLHSAKKSTSCNKAKVTNSLSVRNEFFFRKRKTTGESKPCQSK